MEAEWAPLAGDLVKWVALEREARATDATVKSLTAAKKWVTANAAELRNRRLLPLARAGARDLVAAAAGEQRRPAGHHAGGHQHQPPRGAGGGGGRRVRRGAVGDEPGRAARVGAGVVHPARDRAGSPFRFLVLDDPIQAMDPAKVEGFVRVLERIAATRQVIVFSHDDRLATAIRNLAVDARIVEITRGAGSTIIVTESTTPRAALHQGRGGGAARRQRARRAEGARRTGHRAGWRSRPRPAMRTSRGATRPVARWSTSRAEWEDARTTRQKLALAVEGDREASIDGWLSYRAYRRPVFAVCTRGAHQGAVVDKDLLRDLRAMVDELETLR